MKKRIICGLLCIALVLCMFPISASAASFVSWNSNQIITNYAPTNIIVADDGISYVTNNDNGIMKYLPNGNLDTSFGNGGKAVETIRPISLCFDQNGDILTGNTDAPDGVFKISASTGLSQVIIPDVCVVGIAVDSEKNMYVNCGNKITKYNSSYIKISEVSFQDLSMGVCLLKDGSIVTSNQVQGTIYKYNKSGSLDTDFGTNGALKVSSQMIGFASYNDGLYVSCFGEGKVKKVSDDGKSVTDVFSGASPTVLLAKNGYYFITNWLNNLIECFEMPKIDTVSEHFSCTATPAHLNENSKENITLNINSTSTKNYSVTAKVYNKTTKELLTDVTASTVSLSGGKAAVVLTPPSAGWPKGEYYVELIFTDTQSSYAISNSITPDLTIKVDNNCFITFQAEGSNDIVKSVPNGGTLTDIPAVPAKSGYSGVWDVTNFVNITGDKIVHAVYSKNKVQQVAAGTATVEGLDGTTFDSATVLNVENITQTITPARTQVCSHAIAILAPGNELVQLYDVKLLLNNQPYPLNGGKVRVKIKIPDGLKNFTNLQVAYIDDNGNATAMTSYVEGDYIVFETTHFSNYALIGTPKSTTQTNPTKPASSPNTGDRTNVFPFIIVMVLSIGVILVIRNRNKLFHKN